MSKNKFSCELPVLVPSCESNNYRNWDGIMWKLIEDTRILFENDRIKLDVVIKPGFETDGGSIPKRLQGTFSPLGYGLAAYLVHDILYATELLERSEADWILLELLQELGFNWVNRNAQYSAVRVGGSLVWKKHTKESIENARKLVELHYELKK